MDELNFGNNDTNQENEGNKEISQGNPANNMDPLNPAAQNIPEKQINTVEQRPYERQMITEEKTEEDNFFAEENYYDTHPLPSQIPPPPVYQQAYMPPQFGQTAYPMQYGQQYQPYQQPQPQYQQPQPQYQPQQYQQPAQTYNQPLQQSYSPPPGQPQFNVQYPQQPQLQPLGPP